MEWSLFKGDTSGATTIILLFIFVPLVLFLVIYAYYRILKLVRSRCPNCGQRPKMSLGRWLWEIWKISATPWKKVRAFCNGCRKKVTIL